MPYCQGAEPPWFAAAMTWALAPIGEDIVQLTASNVQILRIAAIVESFISFFQWFLTNQMQTWNWSSGSGRDSNLEIVPFWSGEDPTTAPVCLLIPCLGNGTVLNTFVSAQSTTSDQCKEGAEPQCSPL